MKCLRHWKAGISEVARCPNVTLKVGGLGMNLSGMGWDALPTPPNSATVAAAWRAYVLHAIEEFSPGRCMFESNFPVDGETVGYGVIWNAFKRIVADFSAEEQRALFHDTAARTYRLASA